MIDIDKLEQLAKAALIPTEHEKYFIDANGDVWSSQNWRGYGLRKLVPSLNSHGYLTVKVCCSGGMKKAFVHKLVCTAFHEEKPSCEYEVRHLDGNKENNNAYNLCWGTKKENAHDRKIHGTEKAAENGRKSAIKLTGRYNPHCLRGHDKEGRKGCETCRRMARKGLI